MPVKNEARGNAEDELKRFEGRFKAADQALRAYALAHREDRAAN